MKRGRIGEEEKGRYWGIGERERERNPREKMRKG